VPHETPNVRAKTTPAGGCLAGQVASRWGRRLSEGIGSTLLRQIYRSILRSMFDTTPPSRVMMVSVCGSRG
jgi:hypothetical protein